MNRKVYLVVCFLLLSQQMINGEERIFEPNGYSCTYRYAMLKFSSGYEEDVPHSKTMDEFWAAYADRTHYATLWLGNDTVVSGEHCLPIWEQTDGETTAICRGYLCEKEDGTIYRMLHQMNSVWQDYFYDEDVWYFLYDFSNPDMKVGDQLEWVYCFDTPFWKTLEKVEDIPLLNGQTVRKADDLIYGIGYLNQVPFCCLVYAGLFMAEVTSVTRKGQLVYDVSSGIGVVSPNDTEDSIFDFQGRPVAQPQTGIYIQGGKKILIK